MIRIVIWIDVNAQSVFVYQIWIFLTLRCPTCWEDSRDYKFIIFGHLDQKIWIKQVNRSVWLNLKLDSKWILKLWNNRALMDSRCFKDSNDILFAIFQVTGWKLWIIKDLDEIWFEILFESCFKSGADTWRVLIRRYHFGWITDWNRRI
jgi:hypothetical protein